MHCAVLRVQAMPIEVLVLGPSKMSAALTLQTNPQRHDSHEHCLIINTLTEDRDKFLDTSPFVLRELQVLQRAVSLSCNASRPTK